MAAALPQGGAEKPRLLLIFGGHSGKVHLHDLHVLDVGALVWSQPVVSGPTHPPGLRGHSGTMVGRSLVVFGGFDGRARTNETWLLNTDTWVWRRPPTPSACVPPVRQRHTACHTDEGVLIYGGFDGTAWLSDAYLLTVERLPADTTELVTGLAWLVNNADSFCDIELAVEGGAGDSGGGGGGSGGGSSGAISSGAAAAEDGSSGTCSGGSGGSPREGAPPPNSRGSTLLAHRALLAARIPFFRAMFSSGLRESAAAPGTLRLSFLEYSRATVLALLEWAYTGGVLSDAVRNQPAVALEALQLADQLGAEGFKALAEEALCSSLDEQSAPALLVAASRCGAAMLKGAALRFIVDRGAALDLSGLTAEPTLLLEVTMAMARARTQGNSGGSGR